MTWYGVAVAGLAMTAAGAWTDEPADGRESFDAGVFEATLETRERIDAADATMLVAHNPAGEIEVEGWEYDEIDLVVTRTMSRMDWWTQMFTGTPRSEQEVHARMSAVQTVIEVVDGAIEIRLDDTGFGLSDGIEVEFELRVPRALALELEGGNGEIEVEEVEGDVKAETANGGVRLREIGGDVEARTANGSVELLEVGGAADVKTSNGRIAVVEVEGALTLHTSNGEIDAVHEGDQPVECVTNNGGIRLVLAHAAGHDLKLRSRGGSIRCDVPLDEGAEAEAQSLNGTSRGGGTPIELRTSNGSIELVER